MRQNYKMNTNNSEYAILHSVKENVLTLLSHGDSALLTTDYCRPTINFRLSSELISGREVDENFGQICQLFLFALAVWTMAKYLNVLAKQHGNIIGYRPS